MINKTTIFILLYLQSFYVFSQNCNSLFQKNDKLITVPNILLIKNCANWYVDFNRLKKTVIFTDKIISMGLYGGFVCINSVSLKYNDDFTKKINSDFFTNIACYNDTLFAEKYNNIFYLSTADTLWVEYMPKLPVKFFDILYQDDKYIFYPMDFGEWGGLLFIYDKKNNVTKGLNTDNCANSVVKIMNKYLVSSSTRHMDGFSDIFYLHDIDLMPNLVYHSKLYSEMDLQLYWEKSKQINESNRAAYYQNGKSMLIGTIVSSTFLIGDSVFHFIEPNESWKRKILLISKNINDEFVKNDSLSLFEIDNTYSFNNSYIFNAGIYDEGFLLYRNNEFIRIKFNTNESFKITDSYIHNSNHYETIHHVIFNNEKVNQDSIFQEKILWNDLNIASRETNYTPNNLYSIHSEHTRVNDITLKYKNQVKRLKFGGTKNILKICFRYNGNDYLYFYCLGNQNHKYGLIEIKDINCFIDEFCY